MTYTRLSGTPLKPIVVFFTLGGGMGCSFLPFFFFSSTTGFLIQEYEYSAILLHHNLMVSPA